MLYDSVLKMFKLRFILFVIDKYCDKYYTFTAANLLSISISWYYLNMWFDIM